MARLIVCMIVSALLLAWVSGCAAVGAVGYKVMGPPAVEAKYIPAMEPMLVMVENYRGSSGSVQDQALDRYLEGLLAAHHIAPLVDATKLRELRRSRPDYRSMSVSAVATAIGAKQVLYVDVVQNTVEPLLGGESLRGQASVRVKVIDGQTGETRWPGDMGEGYPVESSVQWGTSDVRSESELREAVLAPLADKIAKLFYKWKPDEEEPEGFTETGVSK